MSTGFPERLRDIRTAAGLTATQLAAKVGRSEQSIQLYERGSVTPPIEMVYAMADALGVSVSDLVNDDVRFGTEEGK